MRAPAANCSGSAPINCPPTGRIGPKGIDYNGDTQGEVYKKISETLRVSMGGAGDVLTGVTAALIGQGLGPEVAARLGVYLHGAAGDLARDRAGEIGMAAGDLVITPSYAWHDHHNESDQPMMWFDGLDLPLACYLDAQFFEFYPTGEMQPALDNEGASRAYYHLPPLERGSLR